MAVVLPADHMAVSFHHTGGSVTGEMVNTCAYDISTYASDPLAALVVLSNAWASTVHGRHVSAITYTKATAMYHDPIFGLVAYETTAGTIVGSVGSVPVPMNVAVIVQKDTGFAGRKFRGRMFFGGIQASSFDAVSPNTLDDDEKGTLQTAFDTFRDEQAALGILPVLLHQTGGPTPTLITRFSVHTLVGTMRKRIR